MNQIYNKNKPKRKYVRKPLCNNTGGICTCEKCRCDIAIKEPKTKRKIDENLLHREKVIKRRREIELNKIDEENFRLNYDGTASSRGKIKGYNPKKKKVKWYSVLFKIIFWSVVSLMIYVVIINLLGI